VIGVAPAPTFEAVYDANVDYVWRIVARLGVRPAAVEDVAQEVFVVVHRKLADFEGRSSVRTWLFQIARRVVHDHRRTVRRKEPPVTVDEVLIDTDQLPAGEESGPDAAAARAQAVVILHDLLDKLDDEKREVFILAELEQLPAPQIAEAVGINLNTVYSRLRLAREAFNQALARHQAHQAREGRQR
jgi:RNA polymerase sigma-70 factor (ECF subfamily)